MTIETMKQGQDIVEKIATLKRALLYTDEMSFSYTFPDALETILRDKAREWLKLEIDDLEQKFSEL